MFCGAAKSIRLVICALALTPIARGQATADVSHVLSDKEARKLVSSPTEATVPPGMDVTSFTVGVSVAADGHVTNVENINSLPDSLFATAASAARRWYFRPDAKKPHPFEADLTFHGPISGTVTTADGRPAAGVDVFGSEWTCCPTKHDDVKTDQSGSFRIEHPGEVLHFFDGMQTQSIVVTPEMSKLKVTLNAANSVLALNACGEVQRGFERLGEGKYGLQFDVPTKNVKLIHGTADVDYVVHLVQAKGSHDRIEFWFGPYAMDMMPYDQRLIESESFETRPIVMAKGVVPGGDGGFAGADTKGRMLDGRVWRQVAFGAQGPRYLDVSPENAAIFDRIIDSACWIPYPKH